MGQDFSFALARILLPELNKDGCPFPHTEAPVITYSTRKLLNNLYTKASSAHGGMAPAPLAHLCSQIVSDLNETLTCWGQGKRKRPTTGERRAEMLNLWRLILQNKYPNEERYLATCAEQDIVFRSLPEYAVLDALAYGANFEPYRTHALLCCGAITGACQEMLAARAATPETKHLLASPQSEPPMPPPPPAPTRPNIINLNLARERLR